MPKIQKWEKREHTPQYIQDGCLNWLCNFYFSCIIWSLCLL